MKCDFLSLPYHISPCRFVGGEMNTCYNAVDRHVDNGFGEQTAIIHDSPMTNSITKLSFKGLQQQVQNMMLCINVLLFNIVKNNNITVYHRYLNIKKCYTSKEKLNLYVSLKNWFLTFQYGWYWLNYSIRLHKTEL